MKLLRRSAFAILCGLMFAAAALAQPDWLGTYEFGENGGKNAGGTVIFVYHELTVFESDTGLAATLTSNGYQTSRNLNCTAKAVGQKLMVYFDRFGEDNFLFDELDKGDLLFTLELKKVAGKMVTLTYWGKFTPIVTKNERSGRVYFVRSETQRL